MRNHRARLLRQVSAPHLLRRADDGALVAPMRFDHMELTVPVGSSDHDAATGDRRLLRIDLRVEQVSTSTWPAGPAVS